jgi:hypothetical protein
MPCDKILAIRRNKPQSPIDIASISLPKSPVSSSPGDVIPHMFIRKSRLQLGNLVTSDAKRLLQHNRHLADNPAAPAFVRYWGNSGQRSARALNGSVANDPGCVKTSTSAARVEIFFEKLRDMRTDNAADIRLNAMLGNCIFYISPMYEFSHSLDPERTSHPSKRTSKGRSAI